MNIFEKQGIKGAKKYLKNAKKNDRDDFLNALILSLTEFKIWKDNGCLLEI